MDLPDNGIRAWTPEELHTLHEAWSIMLAAETTDGPPQAQVEVGVVTIDDGVYVRAYQGVRSVWYQATQARGRGTIQVGNVVLPVRFEAQQSADDADLALRIDAAYSSKYGSLASGIMTRAVREATVRIHARH
ncbi:hypothetical protein GCM10023322_12590 [Rugosimonospora acidiphila]|uniref:DUF2255 family protein n=1 Tax=Rugosimonospora acidiphila TaxID=556531 RepID=A0ABP9RLK7_9ACTN